MQEDRGFRRWEEEPFNYALRYSNTLVDDRFNHAEHLLLKKAFSLLTSGAAIDDFARRVLSSRKSYPKECPIQFSTLLMRHCREMFGDDESFSVAALEIIAGLSVASSRSSCLFSASALIHCDSGGDSPWLRSILSDGLKACQQCFRSREITAVIEVHEFLEQLCSSRLNFVRFCQIVAFLIAESKDLELFDVYIKAPLKMLLRNSERDKVLHLIQYIENELAHPELDPTKLAVLLQFSQAILQTSTALGKGRLLKANGFRHLHILLNVVTDQRKGPWAVPDSEKIAVSLLESARHVTDNVQKFQLESTDVLEIMLSCHDLLDFICVNRTASLDSMFLSTCKVRDFLPTQVRSAVSTN